jgi:hypothetical protein
MNTNPDLNKKEGTIFYQSIMSLLSIIIFAIGISFATGGILFLFQKIIGLDTSVTIKELLENVASIPDFFSNVISYSVCRIILAAISIPLVLFLAIRDRFKGSYMNLVDLKKYKFVLCFYAISYTAISMFGYNAYFNNAVDNYVSYNSVIQEHKADEQGYFNDGVKRIEILPTIPLVVFPIFGIIAIYVSVATAEATNRKYLDILIQSTYPQQENIPVGNQGIDYNQQAIQQQVVEDQSNNIFY